ncbi:TnsD family transposase [Bacillus cereus group sp. TH230-1LC]|nr:TnsD family transposase [Bacillus cereus group sp. TH230-1LC]
MLTFFPSLYEEELLYSALTRYHNRSCNKEFKDTLRDLYGDTRIYIMPDLIPDLKVLQNRLKYFNQFNINDCWEQHTFFHYYTNFLNAEVRNKVKKAILSNEQGVNVHYQIGYITSTVKEAPYFRFCAQCLQEDLQGYGETYWRVYQQLPSVFVCLKHRCLLQESSEQFRRGCSTLVAPLDTVHMKRTINNNDHDWSKQEMEHLIYIAKQSRKLVNTDYLYDLNKLQKGYRYLLQKRGYVSVKGNVKQGKLARDFISYFGEKILHCMQSMLKSDESCWLKAITRKHRKSFHPIRHILLIYFLEESVDSISNYSQESYKPFGEGPYPCLNPATQHYLQPVIKEVKISRCSRTKRPIGTFGCTCGFIYSRKGPDKFEEDKMKISRIKSFGYYWKERLHEYIFIQNLRYRECARRLKVDVKTVIKYSKDMLSNSKKMQENNLLDKWKDEWKSLMNKNSDMTKTELRNLYPNLYMRLYRNDKDWLREYSPKLKKRVKVQNRIDWGQRDMDIVEEVNIAIKSLMNAEKPIRLTIGRIGREIKKSSLLEKKLNKLPLTRKLLHSVTESVIEFQKRRIEWVFEQLIKKEDDLAYWKVLRMVGLRADIDKSLQDEILARIHRKNG